jgi:hypothetical protein
MQESGGFESIWHFEGADHMSFAARGTSVLEVLSELEGFQSGRLLRNVDRPATFVITTQWRDAGSMRRALSSTRAKLEVWPLIADMKDQPSAFETLVTATPGRLSRYPTSVAGD